MKTPNHILVIRLSAMGDVAMTVPVIESLRSRYPHLRITILTRPAFQVFFRDIEGIEFLPLDLAGRHKGAFGLLRLAADARRCGADAVADLHDVLRSKVLRSLLRLCGRSTASIDKGRSEKRRLVKNGHRGSPMLLPTVERYRKVFLSLGFDIPSPQQPAGRQRPVPEAIARITGPKTGLWTGIAPFAGHPGKAYPTAQVEKLASILAAHSQWVFLLGGGKAEQEITERIAGGYENVVSVIGKVRLGEELDLISNMDAVVTMDSSALHMASIVGTRAVSVWGATHPCAGFYGLGQNPQDAVQADMECRPCSIYGNKPCKKGDYPCMRAVSPAAVAAKVLGVSEENLL